MSERQLELLRPRRKRGVRRRRRMGKLLTPEKIRQNNIRWAKGKYEKLKALGYRRVVCYVKDNLYLNTLKPSAIASNLPVEQFVGKVVEDFFEKVVTPCAKANNQSIEEYMADFLKGEEGSS